MVFNLSWDSFAIYFAIGLASLNWLVFVFTDKFEKSSEAAYRAIFFAVLTDILVNVKS